MWNLWLILLFSDDSSFKGVLAQGIAEPETASAKKSASQLSQKSQASQSSTAFRDDTPSQSASRQSVYEDETPKPRESRLKENNIKQEKQDRMPRSSSVDRYYILFCIRIYLIASRAVFLIHLAKHIVIQILICLPLAERLLEAVRLVIVQRVLRPIPCISLHPINKYYQSTMWYSCWRKDTPWGSFGVHHPLRFIYT